MNITKQTNEVKIQKLNIERCAFNRENATTMRVSRDNWRRLVALQLAIYDESGRREPLEGILNAWIKFLDNCKFQQIEDSASTMH